MLTLLTCDVRDVLPTLASGSVQTVITSPPYYALRSYLHAEHPDKHREIGSEATPDDYIATMVAVFREVKRILREDGVCFINMGDSYCSATQNVRYVLREDLTVAELQRVVLAVFGVWVTGDEEASQGPLSEMLRGSLQGEAVCGQSTLASGREQDQLPAPSSGGYSENNPADQADESRSDQCAGGQMRLLWRDDTAVPDAGSHQWGRRSTSAQTRIIDQGLPRSAARGISEAQVPYPVLQLQLRDRLMGLLSSRQFTDAEIPAAVRACFKASPGLKPKDLLMMPARLALALQADGWWLRSDIIWAKPNPMPESVTDRPTSAHEHVFLLTKSARYFYDAAAVAEPSVYPDDCRKARQKADDYQSRSVDDRIATINPLNPKTYPTRSLRNVWTIATAPFPAAHFATFPPALAERCIKAGTSERGCCAACGAPWVRQTERSLVPLQATNNPEERDAGVRPMTPRCNVEATTTGWSPSCTCGTDTKPCTVLDPFSGAGTALLVADRLGRDAIGIDLSHAYVEMSRERLRADCPLFADINDAPIPEHPEEYAIADLFAEAAE